MDHAERYYLIYVPISLFLIGILSRAIYEYEQVTLEVLHWRMNVRRSPLVVFASETQYGADSPNSTTLAFIQRISY